jgi:hypothetical protein
MAAVVVAGATVLLQMPGGRVPSDRAAAPTPRQTAPAATRLAAVPKSEAVSAPTLAALQVP